MPNRMADGLLAASTDILRAYRAKPATEWKRSGHEVQHGGAKEEAEPRKKQKAKPATEWKRSGHEVQHGGAKEEAEPRKKQKAKPATEWKRSGHEVQHGGAKTMAELMCAATTMECEVRRKLEWQRKRN